MRGLEGKGNYSERGRRKNTKRDTGERKQGHRMRLGRKRVSHVWSNSSLLEVDSSSAAEERV